ncbi:MAG TPA: hypothetical protein VHX86_06915 [Tepidisphaeraceae bacterium]|nr:hypothetical protein [Tepidisphaeraceae bacterium]
MLDRTAPTSRLPQARKFVDRLGLLLWALVIGASGAGASANATTQPVATTTPSVSHAAATTQAGVSDLANLSLEDLMNIQVTTDHK